eukprot:2953476-Amphidinium_carterae.1
MMMKNKRVDATLVVFGMSGFRYKGSAWAAQMQSCPGVDPDSGGSDVDVGTRSVGDVGLRIRRTLCSSMVPVWSRSFSSTVGGCARSLEDG